MAELAPQCPPRPSLPLVTRDRDSFCGVTGSSPKASAVSWKSRPRGSWGCTLAWRASLVPQRVQRLRHTLYNHSRGGKAAVLSSSFYFLCWKRVQFSRDVIFQSLWLLMCWWRLGSSETQGGGLMLGQACAHSVPTPLNSGEVRETWP